MIDDWNNCGTYTGIRLSREIEEAGLIGNIYRVVFITESCRRDRKTGEFITTKTVRRGDNGTGKFKKVLESYPSYDLFWDICIKYGESFWGNIPKRSLRHITMVASLLQQGEVAEAEKYIFENSILFNKRYLTGGTKGFIINKK